MFTTWNKLNPPADKIDLTIDGIAVSIRPGETLRAAIAAIPSCESSSLELRPLAARIGGKIYDLHYMPQKPLDISLIRYGQEAGRRVYERSLKFVLFAAIRRTLGDVRMIERYSLGKGIYITVDDKKLDDTILSKIRSECDSMINADLPFKRHRMKTSQAADYFKRTGREDMVSLLSWRRFDWFDAYTIDGSGYMDYFYGTMLPSTGYITAYDLTLQDGALIMLMPKANELDRAETYSHPAKLANVFRESDRWGELMQCDQVSELNGLVKSGKLRELIRVNEALHERSYAKLADDVIKSAARAVMVAGPSSSGKTTSANRLATQLRTLGSNPVMLSLDNYYLDRDKIEPDANGEVDLEHINTLDVELFSHHLAKLMRGETVETPIFDFKTGKRAKEGRVMHAGADSPVIVEGIHGLNPAMLTSEVKDRVFKIYVSALTTLNLDDHNRIRTTDIRLLRRLVRDYRERSAGMEHTLSMWQSVRRGEETWIFPYQEEADVIFNTTLVYEPVILKRYVYAYLNEIAPSSPFYAEARELVKFLNYFCEADESVEREIPPTSILREFIGSNTFYE